MSSQPFEFAFDLDQLEQSARNYYAALPEQKQKLADLKAGRYSKVEGKERLAKRASHLVSIARDLAPAGAPLTPKVRAIIEKGEIEPEEMDDETFERVIGETQDFLSFIFFEKALQINRCVGRVVTRLGGGRVSYGTGFLVSPRLLLTNNHVLRSAQDAAQSKLELDYQQDSLGAFMTVHRFVLKPENFFLTDKALDFSLVALDPEAEDGRLLSDYDFCPLLKAEGKIIIGEPINIIQHPLGQMKQVVVRNNRLTNLLTVAAHYEADTQPGSSGSPVFNDQWEVVALHHSGVPKKNNKGQFLTKDNKVWKSGDDPALLAWVANEGIRISKLVAFIEKAPLQGAALALRTELLNPPEAKPKSSLPAGRAEGAAAIIQQKEQDKLFASPSPAVVIPPLQVEPAPPNTVTVTIPLTVTISLGNASASLLAQVNVTPIASNLPATELAGLERVEQDTNYKNRRGFNPRFLGFPAPLPSLTNRTRREVLRVPGAPESNPYELKYHHFSVIMNEQRRLAYVAAVNYNGAASKRYKRESVDRWFFDARVGEEFQAGDEFYAANDLDRGHLVRRLDAAWGRSLLEAKRANDDTFHFTNCSPQHEIFNRSGIAVQQGLLLWGNLEDHIADNVSDERSRMSIFSGPVFHRNDRVYRGLQLPREFYKIIVAKNRLGQPMAVAFLLSQKEQLESLEEFVVGDYKPFQVRIADIEKRTGLDFGAIRPFDIKVQRGLESEESTTAAATEINSLEDIEL